ncbi:twin-arginine translocation signal domain-containing protein [Natronobacterium gregoryi]|uniref:Uncharacterized protein n=2 Tax=Natronobacterium gregoryi TaxID=44930 RepID=L0AI71_NATGS|nr:twin-arginine translocation signal domain-containing protein [Natronobacterium gregoryi]AFZ72760.1 hypothetical protein Natgr_1555 [Natronobacterium gregoryi SP2]ELY69475.1 hypothetical protein C490_08124 [Natronobacterium gregoryi SP2]PLK21104.1 hypothetical protein CYV19_05580 [Natronobacterium gregoryi SP2]SFJ11458.1 hypothetical protein SAMN05443661_11479 [Natronobacterium gregoryi]
MNRRQFLATGATLASIAAGGCVGCATAPSLSLSMEATSNADIADRLTRSLESDDEDDRIALEAAEGETVTAEGLSEPFPSESPYVHDGAVYVAETTVTDRTPGTSFGYKINPVDEDETLDPENAIHYEDLPEVDRDAFGDRWDSPEPFLGYGASVYYLEDDVDDSVLVPDQEYEVIAWPETRGRLEIDDGTDRPLKTYEYTAEVVADSLEAYGREIRDLVAFELGPLDDDTAAVVEQAIEGGTYSVPDGEELSATEARVATEFEGEEQVRRPNDSPRNPSSPNGRYVVRYENEIYWTEIRVQRE